MQGLESLNVYLQPAAWSSVENSSILFQFLVCIRKTEETTMPVLCLGDTYAKPGSPCQKHLARHCLWIEEVINTVVTRKYASTVVTTIADSVCPRKFPSVSSGFL